jgi:hypothetical protein
MKMRNARNSRRATYTSGVRDRICPQCGGVTKGVLLCSDCFYKSADGKAEMAYRQRMKKYEPLQGGGPCAVCLHWTDRCSLGFPEGGSPYASDCPAMFIKELHGSSIP